jgi:hypothetical protein
MKELLVVYPPDDIVSQATQPGWDQVGVYHSLEEIPPTITRDAGFRCYAVSIPEVAAIAGGGQEFRAQSSPRELLEGWDRERLSHRSQVQMDTAEPAPVVQELPDLVTVAEGQSVSQFGFRPNQPRTQSGQAAEQAETAEQAEKRYTEGLIVLHSPVDGIPPTHCHVLDHVQGALPLFRVATRMDVKRLTLGELFKEFSPPITLEPDTYALSEDLVPMVWKAGASAAP